VRHGAAVVPFNVQAVCWVVEGAWDTLKESEPLAKTVRGDACANVTLSAVEPSPLSPSPPPPPQPQTSAATTNGNARLAKQLPLSWLRAADSARDQITWQ